MAPLAPSAGDIVHHPHPDSVGRVSGYPEVRDGKQKFVLIHDGGKGKSLVSADAYPKVATGDHVRIVGQVEPPPTFDGFDYRAWLARQGIHSVIRAGRVGEVQTGSGAGRAGFALRQSFRQRVDRLFPEPAAAFLQGILIGEREGMPDSLQSAFQRTGTVHLLALSGYNVSIVIGVGIILLGRRPWAVTIVLTLLAGFVWVVGPSASVLRAALSGGLILLAQTLGRPQLALQVCLAAGAMLLLISPWSLRYDVGFGLSFLATIGILVLEEPIRRRLLWLPKPLRPPVSATLAASLPTTPVIAASFGTVSLIAPVANLLLVPLVPLLMLAGFLTVGVSVLSTAAGAALAVPVSLAAAAGIASVRYLADLPAAQVTLPAGAWPLVMTGACGWVAYRVRRHA